MIRKIFSIVFAGLLMAQPGRSQAIISLYPGQVPGSENWDWQEQRIDSNIFHTPIVYNVVRPSLLVFPADPARASGTALIIAPGGGFQTLSINSEGTDVAKYLQAKGVTVFVLKYRLAHSFTNNPIQEMMAHIGSPRTMDSIVRTVVPLSIADGLAAMDYVRQHAAAYQVNPNRIGFMGFSAGGTVALGVVSQATEATHPDFIAPVYAYAPPELGLKVPSQKTPAFIAAASDDPLGLAPHSVAIYTQWINAHQPAELHLYARGGHGFGMKKQNMPTDTWIDRFADWLAWQGLLKK